MNKFYGPVGFEKTEETAPGAWMPKKTERNYSGDLIRNIGRYDTGNKVISDFSLNNQISIVCDPYALENFQFIKYVIYLGTPWKVTSVDVNYPRLILSLGGVYKEAEDEE